MVVNIAAVRTNALTLSTQVFLYGSEANPAEADAIARQVIRNWRNQTSKYEQPIAWACYATEGSDKYSPVFVAVLDEDHIAVTVGDRK